MKHHPLFRRGARRVLPLLFLAVPCAAQAQSRADSLRLLITARQEEAARAAEVFLDRRRPIDERLRAASVAEAFLAPQHRAAAAAVARDEREDPRVRARALLGVLHAIGHEDGLIADAAAWLASPRTPPVLREAAMQVTEVLLFSFSPPSNSATVEALRAVLTDPDSVLRGRAFAALASHDDEAVRTRLLEGLRGRGGAAPLPPWRAVELLGVSLNEVSLPVLHQTLIEPPDAATRIAAIRLLGGYAPSRPFLVRYLQDPRETGVVRMAAMGALHAGAPREFSEYALPVVEDEAADEALRIYAIRAVQYRRPRARAGQALDAFDAAVRRLATAARSEAVRAAAADFVIRRGI